MVIYTKEKKERSLGEQLFLKAHRCDSPKCAMMRRPNRPGVHGKRPRKLSDYAHELRAKQKLKVTYGLTESQLKRIFLNAFRHTGITGEKMIQALESRLDSALYRSGIVASRIMARHMIVRGHIVVNGRKARAPSHALKVSDVFGVRSESKTSTLFRELSEKLTKHNAPTWLEVDSDKLQAKVVKKPEGVDLPRDINAVIEFFAKNN